MVVAGISEGGLNALSDIVAQCKEDMDIAVFIVMYLSRESIGDFLVHRLQANTTLQFSMAVDGQLIERGHIYIAAPNQHLPVKNNCIIPCNDQEENH